jgi:hypothetical protein
VIVKPTPAVLPDAPAERQAILFRELHAGAPPSVVVRRYRMDASPVIRDVRQGWRTGRVELVFDGHFDVIGDLSPALVDEAPRG